MAYFTVFPTLTLSF